MIVDDKNTIIKHYETSEAKNVIKFTITSVLVNYYTRLSQIIDSKSLLILPLWSLQLHQINQTRSSPDILVEHTHSKETTGYQP